MMPGPWRAENGLVKAVSHGQWFTVAVVNRNRFTPEGRQSNAQSIAALPELLEACEAAYTVLADISHEWRGRHTQEGQALLIQLRNAIAKTLGRSEEDVQNDYGTRIVEGRGQQ